MEVIFFIVFPVVVLVVIVMVVIFFIVVALFIIVFVAMSLFLYYFCYQCLVWDVYKFLKLIFRIVFEFVKDEPVPAFDRDRTHCQSRRRTDLDPGRLRHPLRLSQRPSLTLAIWSSSANLSNVQQRYMVPHAVWKMAKLFCDQIHDRYYWFLFTLLVRDLLEI